MVTPKNIILVCFDAHSNTQPITTSLKRIVFMDFIQRLESQEQKIKKCLKLQTKD
jgi:hypothetical protein